MSYEGEWKDHKRHGKGIYYYPSGKKRCDGISIDGNLNGWCKKYGDDENNTIRYEGNICNGNRHGKGIQYYSNGNKMFEGEFENDLCRNGLGYYTNGNKKFEGELPKNVSIATPFTPLKLLNETKK